MASKEDPLSPTYRYAIGNRLRLEFLQKWLPKMKGTGFNFGASDSNWSWLVSPDAKMWCMDIAPELKEIDLVTDIQCAGIQTETLDWVLCSEVLEHVTDFKAALREIHRCLRPSGKLILTAPFSVPLHGEPCDYWRFTVHAIRILAAAAGFRLIHLEPLGNFSTFLWHTLATEYHRRYFWVSPHLSGLKRVVLKFLSATVPYFCALFYFMAFLNKKPRPSGHIVSWGGVLEKPTISSI